MSALLALLLAASARASTGTQDIAYLNAERAHWGLPAGIAENTTWSQDCAQHDNYERENGGALTHQENSSNPGYTPGGAYAGENSVLAYGSAWTAQANPWENAPIHLIQLFTPSLAVTGVDDSKGYTCAFTWPGMTRAPGSSTTITPYPGDGTTGFPPSENAQEGPFVPGDFVGIPQGTTAGRELFVYLDIAGQPGPAQVRIESASLSGPSGNAAVKWVDNSTGTIGPYLSGGIIIPVKPLSPGSTYTAEVTVAGPSGPISRSWHFTTAGVQGKLAVRIAKASIKRHKRVATFTFTTAGGNAAGFQCALKRPGHKGGKVHYTGCTSPKTYRHLKHGH